MTGQQQTAQQDALAVYMRVSSDQQRTRGTIENQRTLLDRYLVKEGTTAYGWYQDDGVTGTIKFADRPDGARLLSDITTGQIGLVVVTKLDRFGRNAREILNAVHELEQHGARLISLKENVDTRTIAGRFFLTVLAGVAELERDMIAEKTDEGKARRLLETTWMGGNVPYGYRVEGKNATARLVLNEEIDPISGYSEADVVRLMYHLAFESNWSCQRIAAYLDSDLHIVPRHYARTHNPWTPSAVYGILTNTCYTGERTYQTETGEIVTQPVPALLSAETFGRVQEALDRHQRTSKCNPERPYLLRGLMHCALCGALYTTSWRRTHDAGREPGPIIRYYLCSTHHFRSQHSRKRPGSLHPRDCAGMSLDADKLEAKLWRAVERFIRTPSPVLLKLAAQLAGAGRNAEEQRAQLTHYAQDLEALQGERDAILTKYRKGGITERDLDRQLAAMTQEEAKLTAARDTAALGVQDSASTEARLLRARTHLQHLHADLDNGPLTPAKMRAAVEALVISMRVETKEVPGQVDRKGRPKRRGRVVTTYAFENVNKVVHGGAVPAAAAAAAGDEPHLHVPVMGSQCR